MCSPDVPQTYVNKYLRVFLCLSNKIFKVFLFLELVVVIKHGLANQILQQNV